MAFILLQIRRGDDYFYERIVSFIPAPPVFNVVMKSVRPIMPSFSNDIFRMYGDESEWKNQVLDLVDASQLPPSYGGVKGLSKNNAKNNLLVGTFQKEDDGSWWWAKIFG